MASAQPARFGGWTFFIGQILTIASTVIGVYLAGYVGFERTLEYDRLTRAQEKLSLIEALAAEVEDNVAQLTALSERMDPTGANAIYDDAWPVLRTYVWEAAAKSPALFDLPVSALTGVQAFYDQTGRMLAEPALREMFASSSGARAYERNLRKERFVADLERLKTEALPTLRAAAEAPRALLAGYRDRYPGRLAED